MMNKDESLKLAAGAWTAELLPACGGSIASLRLDGVDILRPTPASTRQVLDTASFPLVPYANRIANGRFEFEGRAIELPRNFGDHPHPLHGVGWLAAWQVAERSDRSATLTLDHAGDAAWPWAFRAVQQADLDAQGLTLRLTLSNLGDTTMPAGLGFHPYFPASVATRLKAQFSQAWLSDAEQIPSEAVSPGHFGNWADGDVVRRKALVDHCHAGWDGIARIEQPGHVVTLQATGAKWLHLYMPPGEPFFCVEPVSHLPDAVNRPGHDMAPLKPGDEMSIEMRIAARQDA